MVFFGVVIGAALLVVVLSWKYGDTTETSNTNGATQNSTVNAVVNVNTNTVISNANTNTAIVDKVFLAAHGWDTVVMHQQESKATSQENIDTYDFGTPNAIIDMPKEYVSMITETYGRVSAQTVSIGAVITERVVGASARDGSRMEYMVVPFSSTRSLVIRGSEEFLDDVSNTLVLE